MPREALLKVKKSNPEQYLTIAGLTITYEEYEADVCRITGEGVFLDLQAAIDAKNHALDYRPVPLKLIFNDGSCYTGSFRFDRVRNVRPYSSESRYQIKLVSQGKIHVA